MASTYEKIATYTAPSSTSTYTFSSIPSTYTDLVLVVDYDSSSTIIANIYLRFNGDTGSNYSFTYLQGTGSAAQSGRSSGATAIEAGYQSAVGRSNILAQVQNYSNSTTYKTAISRHNDTPGVVQTYVGLWRNTAAITSLSLTCSNQSFVTGSTFTLYGIKAA
jgi:hypothetical protein